MAFSKVVFSVRRLFVFAAFFATIALSLPTTTTALPVVHDVMDSMTAAPTSPQQRQKRDLRVTKTACAKPSGLQEMFQKINAKLDRTDFLQTAWNGFALNATIPENSPPGRPNLIDIDPNEIKSCPPALTRDAQAPLSHRSLCPYYFRIWRLPEGFYPPTLRTAACKCPNCVEKRQYACLPVRTEMTVLKPAGCFGGMQKYEEFHLYVNTACVCAVDSAASDTVSASGFVG